MQPESKEFQPYVTWDTEVAAYLRDALGEQRFAAAAAALARPPTTTCLRVNTLKTTAEAVVSLVRQQLGPEWPHDTVQVHPQVPCAVLLRGSGPHAVDYAPAGRKEVLVSRKAGEAVLRGAPVFAPGVLAVSSGVGRGELVALAVARERPGSDTPEVTRGTTLYDAPRAAAAVATAADEEQEERGCREGVVEEGCSGADQHTAPSAAPATLPADSAAGEPGLAASTGAGHNSQSGTSCRTRRRQRQRQQGCHGAANGTTDTAVEAVSGAASDSHASSDAALQTGAAAHTASTSNAVDRAPQTEPAVPNGLPAQSAPAGPLLPGWTDSSQGPVPPRTGMYVGLARTAMSRQEMFRSRQGLALELVEPVFRVPPAAGQLPPGWGMLQNLPSLVAALALAPTPGSRVLDMCAAPGGKATLLAQIMEDRGEVVAWDRTHAKVAEIVSLADELGVTCIRAHKMDAGKSVTRPAAVAPAQAAAAGPEVVLDQTQQHQEQQGQGEAQADGLDRPMGQGQEGGPGEARPALSEKARLREERRRAAMIRRGITPPPPPQASSAPAFYPAESFDCVLLDAPCSALGLRPRLQQHAGPLYLRQCAAAQRRLVDSAVRLLRPGGALVYSTCTVNPGENEAVVRYLLDTYGSSFRLVPAGPPFVGGPGLVGRHPSCAEVGVPLDAAAADSLHGAANGEVRSPGVDGADEARGPGAGARGGGGGAVHGEAWLTEEEARMVQRFDPSDPQLDCIGFFVAKFVKTASVAGY